MEALNALVELTDEPSEFAFGFGAAFLFLDGVLVALD
jgi:hypothetical protein